MDYTVELNSELGNDHVNMLTLISLSYKVVKEVYLFQSFQEVASTKTS